MSIKTFTTIMLKKAIISITCIALTSLSAMAQLPKFSLAVQTTTIEPPIPFGGFMRYTSLTGYRSDYSIEILGRFFLTENVALRLRTGITKYRLEGNFDNSAFFGSNLEGQLQKHAIGIESRRILGENLALRFGCEVQIGFFKDMIDETIGERFLFIRQFDPNTVLSLNPLMGADWFIWRGLSLSAELRLPFERIRYKNKGVFIRNRAGTFDNGSYNAVGFGKPICSFQIGYQF
jgi:cellulose synthase/poly-beta-1,6-N-acetylglucosamine synthase-like glycosyltransferase